MINNPENFEVLDVERYGIEGNYEGEVLQLDNVDDGRPVLDPIEFRVDEEVRGELNRQCPSDWLSVNFGIDIYLKAIQIIDEAQPDNF